MWTACHISLSVSPLTTLVATKQYCFFLVSHIWVSVSLWISVPLSVHVCVVILRLCCCALMTRAVPGNWGCHGIVTNSLGRLAVAKATSHSWHTHTGTPTQTHISTVCILLLNVLMLLWMAALRPYYEFMCLQAKDVCARAETCMRWVHQYGRMRLIVQLWQTAAGGNMYVYSLTKHQTRAELTC